MNLTVLADLFGSRASEAVLLHLHHYGETYGRAASKDFAVSLDSVQRQLDRFERTGVMVCRRQGRTLVYTWNPKSRVSKRVRDLVAVAYEGLSPKARESVSSERRQPRSKDKPVIRE
jgi:DNA-binding transcriptional ArsR family regulator